MISLYKSIFISSIILLGLLVLVGCSTNREGYGFLDSHQMPKVQGAEGALCVVKNNDSGDSSREVMIDGSYIGTLYHYSFLCVSVSPGEVYVEVINRKGSGANNVDRSVVVDKGQTVVITVDLIDRGGFGSMPYKLREASRQYLDNVRGNLRQSIAQYKPQLPQLPENCITIKGLGTYINTTLTNNCQEKVKVYFCYNDGECQKGSKGLAILGPGQTQGIQGGSGDLALVYCRDSERCRLCDRFKDYPCNIE